MHVTNALLHHEGLHACQYEQTSFGLFATYVAKIQADIAAEVYRRKHPVIHAPTRPYVYGRILDSPDIVELKCDAQRDFWTLEALLAALDGRAQSLLHLAAPWATAETLIASSGFARDYLPEHIWSNTVRKLRDSPTLPPGAARSTLVPFDEHGTMLGAHHLLEAGAVAAQLLFRGLMRNEVTGAAALYRGAQMAFVRLLQAHAGRRGSRAPQARSYFNALMLSEEQPLHCLLPEHLHPQKTLQLFCAAIDLALSAPLGPWFRSLGADLGWHDVHPGWRFVRLLWFLDGRLRSSRSPMSLLDDMLEDPCGTCDGAARALGWPTRGDMASTMLGDSKLWGAIARAGVLALQRPLPWIQLKTAGPRDEYYSRHPWSADAHRSMRTLVLPLEVSTAVLVDWARGVCVRPPDLSHFEPDSHVVSVRYAPPVSGQRPRPVSIGGPPINDMECGVREDLPLVDAVEKQSFWAELLRNMVVGSAGKDAASLLASRVCRPTAPARPEVEGACERLLHRVFWDIVYG